MSDVAKLIEELAGRIEEGKSVDFSQILELHGRIQSLRESLKHRLSERPDSEHVLRQADDLIEKIILEYVANASASLRNLGKIVASLHKPLNAELAPGTSNPPAPR